MAKGRTHLLIAFILVLMVLAVFGQAVTFDFTNYDDNVYVTGNRYLAGGFSWNKVVWAFLSMYAGNWHPLTWFSHMLDVELFGLRPWGHHLMSVLIHAANAVLLFFVLGQMTGAMWRSAMVAALFAVHPLHVESVAWVAERKDVLSGFFWMLTMGAYLRYTRRPGPGRYALVLLAFSLGVMSKPMIVTLPFVLLLIDYWPLGRFTPCSKGVTRRLIIEKAPLILLSAAASHMTYLAQSPKIISLQRVDLATRIDNIISAYLAYIQKMIWPAHLAALYPYSLEGLPVLWVLLSGLLLVVLCLLALLGSRNRGYPAVGWFWYMGTLVPVIGLVQVGVQSMADRYTYIPIIGLFVVVVWSAADITAAWRYRRMVLAGVSAVVLPALMVAAGMQAGYWRDSITLMERAAEVTEDNYIAHNNLGSALIDEGRIEEGAKHLREAIQIWPNHANANYNLGNALFKLGDYEGAVKYFSKALELTPTDADTHYGLGNSLYKLGRIDKAVEHYKETLKINPGYSAARNSLAVAMARSGGEDQAREHFSELMRQSPESRAWVNYKAGRVFMKQGDIDKAISYYREALRIKPDLKEAKTGLDEALEKKRE